MSASTDTIDEKAETATRRTLLTVKQFCERHQFATEGSLRGLIFHARENGFNACIRRINRRVLLDEGAFFQWLDERSAEAAR